MPTIIDGYNLIFAMGWEGKSISGQSLERGRRRLLSTLTDRLSESNRAKTTVVFDAKRLPARESCADSNVQGMHVLYAVDYPDADTLIEKLIRQHSTPKQLVVVSSDHRLHKAALRRKANPIDSDVWLDKLPPLRQRSDFESDSTEPTTKQLAIDSLETTDWLSEFGLSALSEVDQQAEDEASKDESAEPPSFNPFPPGYGQDLLDDCEG